LEDVYGDGILGVDRSDPQTWHVVVQNNLQRDMAGYPTDVENNKLAQLGTFCLSNSRRIFYHAVQSGMGNSPLGRPPTFAYGDTDSCIFEIGNLKQWPNWQKFFGVNQRKDIGKVTGLWADEKYQDVTYGFVMESVKGDYCSYWMDKFKINFPCLGQTFVLAKKCYYIHCLMCKKSKNRSKGQDINNPILKGLTPQQLWLLQSYHRYMSWWQVKDRIKKEPIQVQEMAAVLENEEDLLFGNIKLPNCLFRDTNSWSIEEHWRVCQECQSDDRATIKCFGTTRETLKISMMSSNIKRENYTAFSLHGAILSRTLRQVAPYDYSCCNKCGLFRSDYADYPEHLKLLIHMYCK